MYSLDAASGDAVCVTGFSGCTAEGEGLNLMFLAFWLSDTRAIQSANSLGDERSTLRGAISE